MVCGEPYEIEVTEDMIEAGIDALASSEFAKHETVNHSRGGYARDDVTTNTVEGFFGIFKRGMVGIHQHCGEQHFRRYLDEFTFRWNNRLGLGVDDAERAVIAVKGAEGKRLTWRRSNEA